MENKSLKLRFKLMFALTALLLVLAIVGISISFAYISYLGLYQSLIVGGAVVIVMISAIITTVLYTRAYQE